MAEIQIKELDPRDRKQFENAKIAIERGNSGYTVELCSSLLLAEPGCIEVRELLRQAQQKIFVGERSFFQRMTAMVKCTVYVAFGHSYLKKNPIKAMDCGEHALMKNPFSNAALSLVASGAEVLDLPKTTVFCLKSICDHNTGNLAIMQRYSEALIKVGDTEQAISIVEKLSRLNPENAAIQELVKSASVAHSINRGKWAEKKEDFRGKLKDGEESAKLERNHRMVEDDGDFGQTARALKKEIRLDPENFDLYKRLVRALVNREKYQEALDWLNKALLHPQADADLALRQLKAEVGLYAKEQELEQLQQKGTSENERILKLESELVDLRLEEARKMIDQFPNDYARRLHYGELLLGSKKIDKAIQQFQISLRSSNLKLKSHVLLGRSFMEKRLFDLGLDQLNQAIEGAVAMDEFKKDVLYVSAQCCEELGNREDAIQRYKQIYASDISFRDVATKIDSFYS